MVSSPETETTGDASISPKVVPDDSMDLDILEYKPGKHLTLFKYDPPEPHGTSLLPVPDGFDTDTACWSEENEHISRTQDVYGHKPLNFNPETARDDQKVTLKIKKSLAGGLEALTQVLLCNVVKQHDYSHPHPLTGAIGKEPTEVVAKVFDPMFFPWNFDLLEGPWKETVRADVEISCEAGAYRELEEKGLTGPGTIAPKYYGTYAARIKTHNEHADEKARWVSVILLEYIDGKTIQGLCANQEGYLIPRPARACPPYASNIPDISNLDVRLQILAMLLEGCVKQLHVGVDQNSLLPENVMVSKKGSKIRVTLIHYRDSSVDSKLTEPDRLYDEFERPPHPTIDFNEYSLSHFAGWFPAEWLDEPEKLTEWLEKQFPEDNYSTGPFPELESFPCEQYVSTPLPSLSPSPEPAEHPAASALITLDQHSHRRAISDTDLGRRGRWSQGRIATFEDLRSTDLDDVSFQDSSEMLVYAESNGSVEVGRGGPAPLQDDSFIELWSPRSREGAYPGPNFDDLLSGDVESPVPLSPSDSDMAEG
ncbi:hypothetical protein CTRI78_v008920 [Colletotrichum trifolii]|uniref:Uncharacterized protein n=1 Tax=Colletotrichum trifolii TaxID=5466 RepID=A0A4R8QS28_COLTR|nr:hypothetical protein CTRI78_v008920 [Colletotrichum trifolii]